MNMEALGRRLRERREQAELSQTEVAKRTGIIQRDISLLERGKKPALWAETLERLAAVLGVSMDYLAGRTDDPRPRSRPRQAVGSAVREAASHPVVSGAALLGLGDPRGALDRQQRPEARVSEA